jgi:hypothetical protein
LTFVYIRGFGQEALIVFIMDYATSALYILHFMTVSLQNKMTWWVTALEILMFLVLNPIAPAISCAMWMIFRIVENDQMIQHFRFLSKLTCLINGTFESPVQIIVMLFFFVTGRIQPPWRDTTEYTDSLGNSINLGVYLSVMSFCCCWVSLIKNVTDSYQSSTFTDVLTVIAFVLPNVLFRIFSYTILAVRVHEWIFVPIVLLLIINMIIGSCLRPDQEGINVFSSSFCSIFCVVALPKDPTIKEDKGVTEMDPGTLKKMTLLITSVSLPVIIGLTWTAHILQETIKQDMNIPFRPSAR